MRCILRSPLLASLAAAAALAQGPPALLQDVETTAFVNLGSACDAPGVAWNSFLYFAADADGHGKELWRTNGAVGGADLFVDLRLDGGSDPQPVGIIGGWLLFVADDGVAGRELWRTNGTAAGTGLLADIAPGAGSTFGSEAKFVRYGAWYYFLVEGALWKTDGQPGNTFPVSPASIGAYELVAGGSQLWMLADNGGTFELWSSDGGSTVQFVRQFADEPTYLVGLPGIRAVFSYDDGVHGREPWVSDGSFGGTQLLVDLRPGSLGSGPNGTVLWNNLAWFSASDGGFSKLWRTDGTAAGTTVIDPANGPRFPANLTPAGSRLFFTARQANNALGTEPWVTDGTAGGTFLVADVWPGSPSSGTAGFAFDGTQWTYFSAHDGSHGYELWRTDTLTTERVSDVQPGWTDSSPTVLGFTNGYCLFSAVFGGVSQVELFASQGNGSQLVRDIRIPDNGSSSPERITPQVDGRFWFTGVRGGPPSLGREAFFSTGAPGGASFLVDTVPGSTGGMGPTTRAASLGIYTFFNSVPGSVLWRTAGTVPSTNAIPGLQATFSDVVEFAGRLYVDGITAATGEELFVIGDPLAGPTLLKDCMPGNGGTVRNLCVAGNRLFFVAQDPLTATGYGNLWVSDGTSNGTQRVYDHGLPFTDPSELRALGRRVVYSLGLNPQLVVSDGTAAGTQVLGNVHATHERVVVHDRMFFAGEILGSGTGVELFVTDGTTFQLVKDIRPGLASSQLYSLTPFGDGVLFLADDGTHGCELWRSDGTAAGTQMVVDLRPGAMHGCHPADWNGLGYTGFVYAPRGAGRALFFGDDGTGQGPELWRTDGTAAGTVLHAELQPGVLGSWPGRPVRCGTQLVFAATQTQLPAAAIGRELFALPTMAAAEPFGTPCSLDATTAPLADSLVSPALGNASFALSLDAAPTAIALLALGEPADVALAPCELRVVNFATPVVHVTDSLGRAQQNLGVPASPSLAGARLAVQWAVLEPGGPFLGIAALSNGVDLVLQSQ